MKSSHFRTGHLLLLISAISAAVSAAPLPDARATNSTANFAARVAAVTAAVSNKFAAHRTSPADMAPDIQAIHNLVTTHLNDGDREQLGRLYLLDAHIHGDALKYPATARTILEHVVKALPGTKAAQEARAAMDQMDAEQAAKSTVGLVAAEPGDPQIGKLAPDFTGQDSNGQSVTLSSFRGRIVVLEMMYAGCPVCANHYNTGAMPELQHELATNGVVWLLIDPIDPPETAGEVQRECHTAITSWIVDRGYQILRTYAARTAPQMFVIDKRGVLAYQGAVDDQPGLSGDPRAARNYVREAVLALLAGKNVEVPETKPYGCRFLYSGMPDEQLFRPPGFR